MGIYYRANMIRLEATCEGTWVASVMPFRPAGQRLSSGPEAGEVIGEFERREEAIAAAQAHIDGKAVAPAGETAQRSRGVGGMLQRLPAESIGSPPGPDPEEPRQNAGEAGALGGVPHEILVIDDDKLTRWSLMKVLGRAGYRVRAAASAAEGLAQAGDAPPDLVLLDVQLPDGDGGSVLQAFRRSRPDLPVVMMSADGTPETDRHLRGLGASGFLAKPCAAVLLLTLSGVTPSSVAWHATPVGALAPRRSSLP
jgi:CheY-like chemotaxis protein